MSAARLRELFEQKRIALRRHPSLARTTAHAGVHLTDGLRCEVRHGERITVVDLPLGEGGNASAPGPGDLMRASLGACLAMSYRGWAARFGYEVGAVEVSVTVEYDARGQLGLSDEVPVGWQRLLFDVRIVSDAPPAELRRAVEHADRLSPMLANLSPAIERVHTLSIQRPAA
ncbi:MAG TPA: OsmC family protein [Polyangiaceae bacterium]|nr:OsmC family protein [Polyangiaceae bacterium]